MTIYYQESRIKEVVFARTENELLSLPNLSLINNKTYKINQTYDELPEIQNIESQINLLKLEISQIKSIHQSSSENKIEQMLKQDSTQLTPEQIEQIKNIQLKIHDLSTQLYSLKTQMYSKADKDFDNILNEISQFKENEIETIIINAESQVFHDIEFTIDSSKVEVNSESVRQDPLSGVSLGSSTMLDSLTDDKFVILPGRKSSNIKSNLNQNHECIDAIATNGLMNSPKIMSEYSVGKLMEAISKNKNLKNLRIYIIHSALKVKILHYSGISTINIPCYAVGKGEILSVFFRYIAITFFSYMTVYDSSDNIDYKYDL